MRYIFIALTIGLGIIGFFIPMAWIGAAITTILAIVLKPPGVYENTKPKFSELQKGLRGEVVGGQTMRDCPFCLNKIKVDARKCPYCEEWVEPTKGFKICAHCGTHNTIEAFQCKKCRRAI
ncbi:MAG: hypothetical protein SRB2_02542 [Desulfobacteraceae bacterium Eth-SRB2]|nr:MAG: hypothetical protein SRB2_02542 [Desulfobacteraceae bacterium Eth-SRB2]